MRHNRRNRRLPSKTQATAAGCGVAFFGGYVLIILAVIVCWIVNVGKLLNCDFEAPYRAEAIHAVGLVGPLAPVALWVAPEDGPVQDDAQN